MWQANLMPPVVLVVDDETSILRLLTAVLARSGLAVQTAESGQAAAVIYHARQEQIALVLLDVQMSSSWDGPRTFTELRRINPFVRVAFMSGSTAKFSADDLLAFGAMAVFPKPFSSVTNLGHDLKNLIAKAHPSE